MRTFCICLPENTERIEKARQHFASHDLDVEFFWGIDAKIAGLATRHVYEVDHPGSGFRIGEKPTGIWLSHYMLWNCLTRLPEDRFLILEDDAKLCDGFVDKLHQCMLDIPSNFDFLYVGNCCVKGHPHTRMSPRVIETKHMQCTHAYVVSRKCLPLLLRTLRKVWAPIDIQLQFECFPHLHTYAAFPRLADQFDTIIPE